MVAVKNQAALNTWRNHGWKRSADVPAWNASSHSIQLHEGVYPAGLQRRNFRQIPDQIPAGAGESDRSAHIREHDEQTERVFCGSREGFLQYVLRGLLGVYHRLSNLYLHGDALRKVLAQGVEVHCDAERACVQSEGTADHRSGVPGTASHRDLDTGPPRAHVTAAVAFHRGILHVIRFNGGDTTTHRHTDEHIQLANGGKPFPVLN